MPKLVWKTLKLCLAILVNVLLLENTTLAEETPAINQNIDSLERINQYSKKIDTSYLVADWQSSDSMA